MAPTFVFAIAGQLLAKLSSLIIDELSLAWGLRDDLRRLENTVSSVHAVLLDAQERHTSSHQMKNWLHKLEAALYHAEDVLEEFDIVALRYKISYRSILKKVSREFYRSNRIVFRFKMSHKIKNIREEFEEIAADKNKFNLIERYDERVVVHREMTHSFVLDKDVIGRDEDKEAVISFLMDTNVDERVSVLPIIGLGGIGKTTLAKFVYNDERLLSQFDLKIWLCIAEEFQLEPIIKEILKSAGIKDCDSLQLEQLQQCLRENLEDKKYFLVLDDLWNENHAKWVELKTLLTTGANGSKILVTTRNQSVASIVGTSDHNIFVQGLSYEESLSLFMKWAFKPNQDLMRHSRLVEIAGSIVEKCKGVPLAVRTLGSILYTKTDESEWINMRDNEIWNIEQEEGHILPALKLSYSQLPTNLRRCFAFCSLFPKDIRFSNFGLTRYWHANGLIQLSGNNQDVEGVGTTYIKKLLSRGFFQEFKDYGSFFTFKMHDLVHDLALLVSEHEVIHLSSQNSRDCFSTRIVRHASFSRYCVCSKEISNWLLEQKKNVHTFIFPEGLEVIKGSFIEAYICEFKSLRTLELCDSRFEVLPSSIGNMKHLKNLNISKNSQLKALPGSICKLVGLESLDFKGCLNLEKFPRGLGQLVRLRQLGITTKELSLPDNEMRCLMSLQVLMIEDCSNLKVLMSNDAMRCLSSLRLLSIAKCGSLESLPLRDLGHLTQLSISDCRYLDLMMGNHCDNGEQGLCSLQALNLRGLPKLETLPLWLVHGAFNLKVIGVSGCENLTDLMPEPIFQKLESLQRFTIRSCPNLTRLPGTMHYLSALNEIRIADCPELVRKCQCDGEYWHQISSVPRVILDDIEI